MYQNQRLSTLLTYAGALPFWALALGQFAGLDPAWASSAFIAYGTGISCFMAGTIWSQVQIKQASPGAFLLLSNGAALAAIAALLLHHAMPLVALILHSAVFITLFFADQRIHRDGDQPHWYLALRRNVTVLVVIAYGVVILAM
ncbi:hypothetical protein ASE36_14045 [Rhizobium sp. Root274]|uniref:DUF3429 domain-containing protein n=1 Tax=unclassified Rhizobium TaxID=2613769 RepID=UPI0007133563|nr:MULTISPECIES: DUF3429 domain-containing protein [unclassified Rhizobium]KQW29539.1 hypothetical protein ASC71_14065 [Rhizobium sp. Root1240]KRD29731.1 hypothetical protein ASE36_14045 [Rhizobium sp. Root274]